MTLRRILRSIVPPLAIMALILTWLPVVLAAGPAPAPQRATVNVSMVDNSFQPQSITIQVGDTVVWTNNGALPHTSTSDTPGLWDSGILSPGQTFSRTFATAGTFPYNCTLHVALGMVGTVVVQAAAQATATTAPAQPTATTAPAAQPTATAVPPTATAPAATATAAPAPAATATAAPAPAATATAAPAPAATATAAPAPAATATAAPAPAVLPRAGDSGLPPWVLLVAGSVIVVGLAVRTAARR